jgi:hypothetical protein
VAMLITISLVIIILSIGTNDVTHFTLDFSYPIKTTLGKVSIIILTLVAMCNVNAVYKYTSPNKHQYSTIPNTLVCIILCFDVGFAMYALRIVTNRIALNNQPRLIIHNHSHIITTTTSKVVMITILRIPIDIGITYGTVGNVDTNIELKINVCISIVISDDADVVINALLVVFT